MAQEQVRVVITGDAAQFEAATRRATASLGQMQDKIGNVERSSATLAASFSRMGHAAAAAFSVSSIARAADAYANLNARLSLVSGSASEAALAYQRVLDIAKGTRQGVEEVAGVYEKFARVSADLGISQSQVANLTESVAQSMAISGASAQSAQAALLQFGQALSAGALRGEELNSILEQAPRLAKALADGLGVPVGKLSEMGEAGELAADRIVSALEGQADRLAEEFSRMPVTVGGALTNLRTAWVDTVGSFEQSSGVFRGLATSIQFAADHMDALAVASAAVAGSMLGRGATALAAHVGAMRAAGIAARQAAAAELTQAQAALASAQAHASASVALRGYAVDSAAVAAAQARLAGAQAASAASTALASRALGLLGGPIGIITTLLAVGATAWSIWGDSAKDATSDVQAALREVQDEAAKTGRLELEIARARRDAARERYYGGSMSAGGPERAEFARWDALVQQLEARERRIEERSKRLVESTSSKWAELYQTQAEQRAAAIADLDKSYAAETAKFAGNQDKQLQLARDYHRKRAELEKKFADKQPKSRKTEDPLVGTLAELAGLSSDYARQLQALSDGYTAGRIAADDYRAAVESLIAKQPFAVELARSQAQAEEALLDVQRRAAAQWAGEFQDLASQVAAKESELAAIGKTGAALAELANARIDETIAAQQSEIARLASIGGRESEIERIRLTIAELEKLKRLNTDGAAAKAAVQAAEEADRAWQTLTRDIEQSLTDAILSGGANGWELLKRQIEATVIRATIAPIVQGGVNSVLQGIGLGPSGGSSGGFGMPGGGAWLSAGLTAAGAGLGYGTAAGTFLGSLGGALAPGATFGGSMAAASASFSAGATASGMGYAIGAAAPYVAAALIAAQLLDSGSDGPHRGGAAFSTIGGASGLANSRNVAGFGLDWGAFRSDRSAQTDQAVAGLVNALASSVATRAARFGVDASGLTIVGKFAADPDNARGGLRVSNAGGTLFQRTSNDTSFEALGADAVRAELAALQSLDIPGVVGEILGGLDPMAASLEAIGNVLAAADAWVTAGEQLEAAIYAAFTAPAQQLQDTFDSLGEAVPGTRDAFESLVRAQDLNTEAGRNTAATLLQALPLWEQLNPALESAAESAGDLQRVTRERASLEMRLLELAGDTAAIRALELEALDPSNRELQQLVWAREDELDAIAAQRAIADERATLEVRWQQMIGDTAALRARELEALDPSNRALQQMIWAREDELASLEKLTGGRDLLAGLQREVEALGRSDLENAIAGISEQADGYIAKLEELGLASYDNILAVEKWADAMKRRAVLENEKARAEERSATRIATLRDQIEQFNSDLSRVGSTLQRAAAAERERITADAAAQREALQARLSAAQDALGARRESASSVRAIVDTLDDGLRRLRDVPALAQSSYAQAVSELGRMLASAQSGRLPGRDDLGQVIGTLADRGTESYGSSVDFLRERLRNANAVESLSAVAGLQLSAEERSLAAQEAAVDSLGKQIEQVDAWSRAQLEVLDAAVAAGEEQIARLQGIDTSIVSMDEAMRQVAWLDDKYQADHLGLLDDQISLEEEALREEKARLDRLYFSSRDQVTAIGSARAGIEAAIGRLQSAMVSAIGTLAADSGTVPAFASGGLHAGGARIVGEDGPELEITGPARYFSASQTRDMLSGGRADITAEEVRRLREDLRAALGAIARNTLATDKTLRRWNGDGMPATRAEA